MDPTEAAEIERYLGIRFPPDLLFLLEGGVPVSPDFPDWRNPDSVRRSLSAPIEGVLFDVRANAFWWAGWGAKPDSIDDALAVAREGLGRAPPLVPVYSHRYIPTRPAEAGNPVFSVVQTDVIHYGKDLADYVAVEFGGRRPRWGRKVARRIDFWTDVVDLNEEWL